MKTMYVCEKCGSQYGDYDKCKDCEMSHVEVGYDGYQFKDELKKYQTWKSGDALPKEAVLVSEDIWKYNEETQESSTEKKFGLYRFVRVLDESEVSEIMEKKKQRQQEEEERWEKYQAEREAKKAQKTQEQEEKSA